MKKLLLCAVTVCLALLLGLGAVTEAGAAYRFRLQSHLPAADTLYSEYIAKNLVEKVRAATDGQVLITAFSGGALVPPPEIFKAVADGVLDMGHNQTGYQSGIMPSVLVFDGLPMAYRDATELLKLINERGLGDILRKEYEKNGVILLAPVATDPYTVLSRTPLVTHADWQGIKVRGYGIWNKFFGLLDASPVEMPLTETYLGLAMGTVDACVTGISPLYLLKFYETCKHGVWPPMAGTALQSVYINPKVWSQLPKDLQEKMTKALQEWADETNFALHADAVVAKQALEDNGVIFAPTDQEWIMQRAQVLWQDIAAADEASAQAIEIITNYLREVGVINN